MTRRSPLPWFYAAAAAVGAITPYAILPPWTRQRGFDPVEGRRPSMRLSIARLATALFGMCCALPRFLAPRNCKA